MLWSWQRTRERVALSQPFCEILEAGRRFPPVDVGQDLVEIAERESGCDVSKRKSVTMAEAAVTEILLHGRKTACDLVALALVPGLRFAFPFRFAQIVRYRNGCICDAVAERFPAPDFNAVREVAGY